jgi:hypothetical protein
MALVLTTQWPIRARVPLMGYGPLTNFLSLLRLTLKHKFGGVSATSYDFGTILNFLICAPQFVAGNSVAG